MEKFLEISDKIKLGFIHLTVLSEINDKDIKKHIKEISKWQKK